MANVIMRIELLLLLAVVYSTYSIANGRKIKHKIKKSGHGSLWKKNCPANQVAAIGTLGDNRFTSQCGQPRICDEFMPCAPAACGLKGSYLQSGEEVDVDGMHGPVKNIKCCKYEKPPKEDQMYESCSSISIKHPTRGKVDVYNSPNQAINPEPNLLIKNIRRTLSGYTVTFCSLRCTKTTTPRPTTPKPRRLKYDLFPEDVFEPRGSQGAKSAKAPKSSKSAKSSKSSKASKTAKSSKSTKTSKTGKSSKSSVKSSKSSKSTKTSSAKKSSSKTGGKKGVGPSVDLECFPGDQYAMTASGPVRMDQLNEGDKVLIHSDTLGAPVFESIDWFLHRDPDQWATFLTLITDGGESIKMTKKHMLPIVPCDFDELNIKDQHINPYLTKAESAEIGSCVLVNNENNKVQSLVNISQSYEKGIYSPFTAYGSIIINNIQASCHSAASDQPSAFQNSFMRVLLSFWRQISNIIGYSKNEIVELPHFLTMLMESTAILG